MAKSATYTLSLNNFKVEGEMKVQYNEKMKTMSRTINDILFKEHQIPCD